ncbi:hypothetical protein ADU78_04075 [Clostridium botulinum]|uniref:hypothetical protein n=1 Tax=Clostridium botulinum TaxID=1491 RepID=UPI0004D4ED2B|nr:hypothetical protein [Clostridium botulinum]KEI02557.1 hypothetical protein Z953_06540 [Clostridium botulinum D str. 16868]KOA77267.1 hypothetical protein ADU78_04075 [Clostridium botulinum]NFF60874.1 hypothetical protein [Clostridium botulinum]NFL03318.1 hypothetical protein [Clostridium botulinum]
MNKKILSPPWYSLNRRLQCIIGNNPHITVSNLKQISQSCYETDMFIDDYTVAVTTRAILPEKYILGNITMILNIYYYDSLVSSQHNYKYTPEEVCSLFTTALKDNGFFQYVICLNKPFLGIYSVIVIINKAVVQFFNDDISDFYLNTNEIASNSFNLVCIHKFPEDVNVHFNTENDRCMK